MQHELTALQSEVDRVQSRQHELQANNHQLLLGKMQSERFSAPTGTRSVARSVARSFLYFTMGRLAPTLGTMGIARSHRSVVSRLAGSRIGVGDGMTSMGASIHAADSCELR